MPPGRRCSVTRGRERGGTDTPRRYAEPGDGARRGRELGTRAYQTRLLGRPQGMRTFTDADGVVWEVEPIYPHVPLPDPRFDPTPPPVEELLGVLLPPSHAFLLFVSTSGQRRRLKPVPRDWVTASDAQLARWCAEATPSAAHR